MRRHVPESETSLTVLVNNSYRERRPVIPLSKEGERWFRSALGNPTSVQVESWQAIAAGAPTLIAAPTGSGKTLAAFMVCLDRLYRLAHEDKLEDRPYVIYISPLKALSYDIELNLKTPLHGLAQSYQFAEPPVRVFVRTGDTLAKDRARMLREPPHLIVTTPESRFLVGTTAQNPARLPAVGTR